MAGPRPNLAGLSLILGCIQPTPIRYSIENSLKECAEIQEAAPKWQDSLAVLEIRYRLVKSTAECGCKSALSTFTAYTELPDGRRPLVSGDVKLAGKNSLALPLALDPSLLGDRAVTVTLGCSLPD